MASERVTPSGFLQRVFRHHGLDAVIVPNIIDLSRFSPAPQRDFGDAPHLIVTRNLEPIYDIPTPSALLRAYVGRCPRRSLPWPARAPSLRVCKPS
ncbi:hypothetical protein [Thauera humireducens]|uniref:hypothetical protein n=1 Tax=Thauera humireducens TaxID=1134435 RepID=UPI00311D9E46